MSVVFRPYCSTAFQACTDIFDANCPEFFAPNERQEYEEFLTDVSHGYEVCEVDGRVLGALSGSLDGNEDGHDRGEPEIGALFRKIRGRNDLKHREWLGTGHGPSRYVS